ncbi:hypothetical protein Trydic_g5867 [Trypoxylus dichotomus]
MLGSGTANTALTHTNAKTHVSHTLNSSGIRSEALAFIRLENTDLVFSANPGRYPRELVYPGGHRNFPGALELYRATGVHMWNYLRTLIGELTELVGTNKESDRNKAEVTYTDGFGAAVSECAYRGSVYHSKFYQTSLWCWRYETFETEEMFP